MYNITKLWKKSPTYRMVNFPDGTYGVEQETRQGKEYLSRHGNWYSEVYNIKDSCRYIEAKDAAEQMQWIRKGFPDAVIKEY